MTDMSFNPGRITQEEARAVSKEGHVAQEKEHIAEPTRRSIPFDSMSVPF